jgi:hypothetical protein
LRVGKPIRSRPSAVAQVARQRLIWLGKQQVEHDKLGADSIHRPDGVGKDMAAQRPTAERGEAAVINQDDGNLTARRLRAAYAKPQVERCSFEDAQWADVEGGKRQDDRCRHSQRQPSLAQASWPGQERDLPRARPCGK